MAILPRDERPVLRSIHVTDQEFAELLALGYERRGIEFKGPGPRSNKQLFAKVVRATLGMTNRRDGGIVVLGVEDSAGVLSPIGLNSADLESWKYDEIADGLAEYADPSVSFDMEIRTDAGKNFAVLHVHEFEDIPVLCKKDYPDVLRKGACYVRSWRKPETSEIPSQEDMRDLLDLATEKRLRKFLARAHAAGLQVPVAPAAPSDRELFEEQLKELK